MSTTSLALPVLLATLVAGWLPSTSRADDSYYTGEKVYSLRPKPSSHKDMGHIGPTGIVAFVDVGVKVTIEGARALIRGVSEPPGALALVVAVGTAAVKEGLFRYTTAVGKEVHSPALLASARDHRADVFIAITVFAGILGARIGLPWLDPAAACAIGAYIAWMAWEPIRENFGVLMDEAPEGARERIFDLARSDPDVREAGEIRVHPLGGSWVVDLVLYVDGDRSLHEAHDIARRVQDLVRSEIPEVLDVRAHVKPTGQG